MRKVLRYLRDIFFVRLFVFHLFATFYVRHFSYDAFLAHLFQSEPLWNKENPWVALEWEIWNKRGSFSNFLLADINEFPFKNQSISQSNIFFKLSSVRTWFFWSFDFWSSCHFFTCLSWSLMPFLPIKTKKTRSLLMISLPGVGKKVAAISASSGFARHLMCVIISNKSRVTPCATFATFSSIENFCISGGCRQSHWQCSIKKCNFTKSEHDN